MSDLWFEDLLVLGALPPQVAAQKLEELGELEASQALNGAGSKQSTPPKTFGLSNWWPFQDKPWQHTAHAFGYLPVLPREEGMQDILSATEIEPDLSLKRKTIKITLNCLRVAKYPGSGMHHVLFDFYAQHQVTGATGNVEHLHFNSAYRVQEGERAAILGYPIFLGLNVGSEGVMFKCFTVNVKNEKDEAFLGFLESDLFKSGLRLADTAQPAIGILSQMALGITRGIATRNRNVPVQEFAMGLDFNRTPMGARLAEGAYIAVQIPETLSIAWDWDDWQYNPRNAQIVNRNNPNLLIPYNYIVFGVSRYDDA